MAEIGLELWMWKLGGCFLFFTTTNRDAEIMSVVLNMANMQYEHYNGEIRRYQPTFEFR